MSSLRPWQEVVSSDDFQNLSESDRAQVRDMYFDEVIKTQAPDLPPEEIDGARRHFQSLSEPSMESSNMAERIAKGAGRGVVQDLVAAVPKSIAVGQTAANLYADRVEKDTAAIIPQSQRQFDRLIDYFQKNPNLTPEERERIVKQRQGLEQRGSAEAPTWVQTRSAATALPPMEYDIAMRAAQTGRVSPEDMRVLDQRRAKGREDYAVKKDIYDNPADNITAPEDRLMGRAGSAVDQFAEDAFVLSPEDQMKTSTQIGAGLGQVGGMIASGIATGGGSVAPLVLGSAMTSQEGYQDAKQSGADMREQVDAAGFGALLGTSELAPIEPLVDKLVGRRVPRVVRKRLETVLGRALSKITDYSKAGVSSAIEEAIQEGFQTGARNWYAGLNYDPDRDVLEGVSDAAELGGTVGGIAGAIVEMVAPGKSRGGAGGMMNQQTPGSGITPPPIDTTLTEAEMEADDLSEQFDVSEVQADQAPPSDEGPGVPPAPGAPAPTQTGAGLPEVELPVLEGEAAEKWPYQEQSQPPVLPDNPDAPRINVTPQSGQPQTELEQVLESNRPVADIVEENEAKQQGFIEIDVIEDRESEEVVGKVLYNPETGETRQIGEVPEGQLSKQPIDETIDPVKAGAVQAAARAETNTEPTEAQKEAGNYKKGRIKLNGLDISIETPKGALRSGTDTDGNPWAVEMPVDYGYIKRTEGADGEQLDVYVGDSPTSQNVYLIDQFNLDGTFDEHKVMMGFDSIADAHAAYDAAFSDESGPLRRIGFNEYTTSDFKKQLKSLNLKEPASLEGSRIMNNQKQQAAQLEAMKQRFRQYRKSKTEQANMNPEQLQEHFIELAGVRGLGVVPEYAEYMRDLEISIDRIQQQQQEANDLAESELRMIEARKQLPLLDAEQLVDVWKELGGAVPKVPTKANMLQRFKKFADADRLNQAIDAVKQRTEAQQQQIEEANRALGEADDSFRDSLGLEPRGVEEIYHNGQKIYRQEVRGKKYWAVQLPKNAGRDSYMGDTLHDTLQEAKEQADRNVAEEERERKIREREQEEQKIDEARKEKNRSLTVAERRRENTLDQPHNYGGMLSHGMGRTRRDFVERAVDKGWRFSDTSGYRAYAPNSDSFYTITKTEYDYAQEILSKQEEKSQATTLTQAELVDFFEQKFKEGQRFRSITQARKQAGDALGEEVSPTSQLAKDIDEAIENATVRMAQDIIAKGKSEQATYDDLVELYKQQPVLNVRTSTSVANQAYSTPAPIAYAVGRFLNINNETRLYEPTAGNGMLLINQPTQQSIVANELNEARFNNLKDLFPSAKVVLGDAMERRLSDKADAVIANPPFGRVYDDAKQQSKTFPLNVSGRQIGQTSQIDHAILFESLNSMKDDGRAVFIIGSQRGVNKALNQEQVAKKYNSAGNRKFFKQLYDNYNVVDHFSISGDLYKRMGAGYPLDVIVINGRGKSNMTLPGAQPPRVYNSFDELKQVIDHANDPTVFTPPASEPVSSGSVSPAGDQESATQPERGSDAGNQIRRESSDVSGAAGAAVKSDDTINERQRESAGDNRGQSAEGRVSPEPTVRTESVGRDIDEPRTGVQGDNVPDAVEPPKGAGYGADNERSAGRGRERTGSVDGASDDVASPSKPKTEKKAPPKKQGEFQVEYEPQSSGNRIGTLVPTNMSTSIQRAVAKLESDVGNIDQYVTNKLQYDSVKTMQSMFAAEQIEALGLAIYNIENGKGFIIGDQTGVGKGRVNAGVLRYSRLNGRIPIFITDGVKLYNDMYRDLYDIGERNFKALVTDTNLSKIKVEETGDTIQSVKTSEYKNVMNNIISTGQLPDGYDYVFTTYDQMNTKKQQPYQRHLVLKALSPNAVISMDEAHNAGGSSGGSFFGSGKKENENMYQSRAKFARYLVRKAAGVMYSSATYAKNPEVMDLYLRTDIALAVDDIDSLGETLAAGGDPLLQVVANMMSESGQYVRRERSFEGVKFGMNTVKADRVKAEAVTELLRDIFTLDMEIQGAKKSWGKELAKSAEAIGFDNATGESGLTSTNFSSIMHNIIGQYLLAMKVDPAINRIIESVESGEKVTVALNYTFESFISKYAEEAGLKNGDSLQGVTFSDMLKAYLRRTREVIVKDENNKKKDGNRKFMDDDLLARHGGRKLVDEYNALEEKINSTSVDLPVSPLDYMHSKLKAAGIDSGEITGRGVGVDYDDDMRLISVKQTNATKRKKINSFNNADTDALILNQSGSTGISLHASEKFKNQKPRRMFILQAAPDINVFMQMLGRVHRTGQVVPPTYEVLVSDLPAEKRIAAFLMTKMGSLNATTTANKDSAVSLDNVTNFLNRYGDEVVARILSEEPEIAMMLDIVEEVSGAVDGLASKATGRMAVLPIPQQERLYELFEGEYRAYINQLNAAGENVLEAKELDLQAETLSKVVLAKDKGKGSPFLKGSTLEKVSVKKLGKPYKWTEVQDLMKEHLNGKEPEQAIENMVNAYKADSANAIENMKDSVANKAEKAEGKDKDSSAAKMYESAQSSLRRAEQSMRAIERFFSQYRVGSRIIIKDDQGNTHGIITAINRKPSNSPVAFGQFDIRIALGDARREFTLPLSQLLQKPGEAKEMRYEISSSYMSEAKMQELFDNNQNEAREERYIVTGNLLNGFEKFRNDKGQVIFFTRKNGDVEPGILMPQKFSPAEAMSNMKMNLSSSKEAFMFMQDAHAQLNEAEILSADGVVSVSRTYGGAYNIIVRRAKGKPYYLNKKLVSLLGDFVSRGKQEMVASTTDEATIKRALTIMADEVGTGWNIKKGQKVLRAMRGLEEADVMMRRDASNPPSRRSNFDKWFKQSKAANADGSPMVLYHGTGKDFDTFKAGGMGGMWFTHDPAVANRFADGDLSRGRESGANVVPVYLSAQKPIETDMVPADFVEQAIKDRMAEWMTKAQKNRVEKRIRREIAGGDSQSIFGINNGFISEKTKATMQKLGYDSLIAKNPDGTVRAWAALEPEQIKSATGNRGTYDPNDPRINYRTEEPMAQPTAGRLRAPKVQWTESKKRIARKAKRAAVQAFGASLNLRFVESITDAQGQTAGGAYYSQHNAEGVLEHWAVIAVGDSVYNTASSIGHEGIHYLRRLGALDKQWPHLRRKAESEWIKRFNVEKNYAGGPHELHVEEAIAEAYAAWIEGKLGDTQPGIKGVFQRIKNFFDRFKALLKGEGFTTYSDIFRDIGAGRYREGEYNPGFEGYDIMFQKRDPQEPSDFTFGLRSEGLFRGLSDDNKTALQRMKTLIDKDAWVVTADEIRRNVQDRFINWRRIQQRIEEMQNGEPLPEELQVHMTEEHFTGRAGEKLDQLNWKYKEPMLQILHELQVEGVPLEQVEEYIYAKHAPERNERIAQINPKFPDGGSGMTNEDAEAIINKAEEAGLTDRFEEVYGLLRKMLDENLKLRYDMGLINKKTYDAWSKWEHYVPLRGRAEMENEDASFPNTGGKGYNVRGPESQRALGRESRAENLIAHSITMAQEGIIRAEKNRVGESVYNLAKTYPNKKIWEINRVEQKAVLNRQTGLVEYIIVKPKGMIEDNKTLYVKIKGNPHRITIHDSRLATPIKNLEMNQVNIFIRSLMSLNHFLSATRTTLSPEFLISNGMRDFQTAAINLQEYEGQYEGLTKATAKDYWKALKASYGGVRGKSDTEWQKYFREYAADGGKVSFWKMDNLEKQKSSLRKDLDLMKSRPWPIAKRTFVNAYQFVENVNLSVENAMRLSAYVNARRMGMSRQKAASLAKNLTVNFNRRGESGPIINAMYLFFNASMQGSIRMLHALKNKRVQKVAAAIVGMGLSNDLLNSLLSPEDDDGQLLYDKIPTWEKESNIIIMDPFGVFGSAVPESMRGDIDNIQYLKIPMAYGYRVFNEIGRNVSATSRGAQSVTDSMANIASSLFNNFNPVSGGESIYNFLAPTFFDPVLDIGFNRDFTGRNIAPQENPFDPAPAPNSSRYYPSVNTWSKWLTTTLNDITGGNEFKAGAIDWSPEYVDYFFGWATGSAGTFVGRTVNAVEKGFINGEELTINQMPFVRKVVGGVSFWQDRSALYDRISHVHHIHEEYNGLLRIGKDEEAAKVKERNEEVLNLYGMMRATQKQLNEIRKLRNTAQATKAITEEERQRRLDLVMEKEKRLIKQFNTRYLRAVNRTAEHTRPFTSFFETEE